MRIRKTFQGQLPDNKILNNPSNSETDTYSCKYINESLVFEEQDPTVPEHVKNISEADIKKWNSGTGGGSIDINQIEQKPKNIITAYLNESTDMAMSAWVEQQVPLDAHISIGDKLTLVNNQVIVGKGISTVKVSASIRLAAEFIPAYYGIFIRVNKADGTSRNIICQYQQKHTVYVSNAIVVNDCLTAVEEGDIISLGFVSSETQTHGIVGGQITSLTVEAVEDGQTIIINNYMDSADAALPVINQVYPIGSIFISTVNKNPSEVFLGTQWEAFGVGRTLVGVDTTQPEFATVEQAGGEKTHLLTAAQSGLPAHNHTQAAHSHLIGRDHDGGSGSNRYTVHGAGASGADATSPTSSVTPAINACAAQNATEAHNNLQPYITVFMWKRIA